MPDGGMVAGHRLTGRTRMSRLGAWYEAVSPGGAAAGLLRFDPGLVADPAARERLVSSVLADRRLTQAGMPGLLPIADLVTAGGDIWLIAAAPVMPAISSLPDGTGGAGPDAGSAATVLAETAQTLLSLHAAGLAHGSVDPETVLLAPDGTALLAERGLVAALAGRPISAEGDVTAWASLVRVLSAKWAAAQPPAAELFDHVSRVAAAHGLAAARDTLLAHRDRLPPGFHTKDRLVETIHWWSAAAQAPLASPAAAPAGFDDGEAVTLLRLPGDQGARPAPTRAAPGPAETGPPPTRQGDDVVMRFGPGVPTETTAAQIWRAGRDQQATLSAQERLASVRGPRRRNRGRRAAVSAAVLALILAGAVLAWLLIPRGGGAALAVTKVDVRGPKTLTCDKTATFVGVITTNGEAGTVRYQWRQSDGQVNKEQTRTVASGETTARVPLQWNVTGPGTRRFTATLRVLSPVPEGKRVEGKATFTYKC